MRTYRLQREQYMQMPVDRVFPFFADPANLQTITPPWMDFRIHTPTNVTLHTGVLLQYTIRWRGLPMRWTSRIEEWNPPYGFVDTQIKGPYALWHHQHRFESCGEGTLMKDIVDYALPLGPLGRIMHGLIVQGDLARVFDFRYEAIGRILR